MPIKSLPASSFAKITAARNSESRNMKPVMRLTVHFASLVFGFGIAGPIDKEEGLGPSGSTCSAPVRLNKHEKLIVLSFDGFRYDYMDKAPTPGLRALRANGVSTKYMNPVFPTKTLVNHQSFVTGLYAESHGIVDSKFEDPKYGTCAFDASGRFNSRFWNYEENVVPIWVSVTIKLRVTKLKR